MSAIRIQGLRHRYRTHFWESSKTALEGLDLEVSEGETFGYLGMNGAGKTTTIKLLVGLLRLQTGAVSIFGKPATDVKSRSQIGFQPENPYFYEYLSARETMVFYAGLCDVPSREIPKRVDGLLEFVGLEGASRVRVGEFSKGMRQRLGIAQCLVHKPKLVILDEPMTGLDPVGRSHVREAIQRLRSDGLTVFFSSHVLGDVEMICDRVGVLQRGALLACGEMSSLLDVSNERFTLTVAGLSEQGMQQIQPLAAGASDRRDRHEFLFDNAEAARKSLAIAVEHGAEVLSFVPRKESLEEYFMRTTGEDRASLGGWSGGADG